MKSENKSNAIGDEYFLSLAVTEMENVRNAAPYIERQWTRGNCYYSSTRYTDESCIILHLIAEKAYGMNFLFSYYQKHNKLPNLNKIARICNLPKTRGKKIDMYMVYV